MEIPTVESPTPSKPPVSDGPSGCLFQVSTSGALVAGVYAGMVDVETILRQGDFELGTFAGLDGEMVVLDGAVYQVCGTGQVSRGVRLAAHSVRYAEEQTVLRINDGLGGGANRGEQCLNASLGQ